MEEFKGPCAVNPVAGDCGRCTGVCLLARAMRSVLELHSSLGPSGMKSGRWPRRPSWWWECSTQPAPVGGTWVSRGSVAENLLSYSVAEIFYSFLLCCLFPSRQCLPPFSIVFSFDPCLPLLCFDLYPFTSFLVSEGKKKITRCPVMSRVMVGVGQLGSPASPPGRYWGWQLDLGQGLA